MDINDIFEKNKTEYNNLISAFQHENSLINLSSFNDTESILNKHIIDSLNIFEFPFWKDMYNNVGNRHAYSLQIADIGTGGGFPGLALAIALPHINFILIESISKKCKAIDNIAKSLDLKNVIIVNDRAENINEEYDICISRAVAEFDKIFSWSNDITKDNGRIYLYKSDKEEIKGFNDKIDYVVGEDKRIIYEFIKIKTS